VRPNLIVLEVGDIVSLPIQSGATPLPRLYQIERIVESATRAITARALEPSIYDTPPPHSVPLVVSAPKFAGKPAVNVLNLPIARENPTVLQYMAIYADPWPEAVAIWRSADGASYDLFAVAEIPAVMGTTQTALKAGCVWRWDQANTLDVKLERGYLASSSPLQALGGANIFALLDDAGAVEILTAAEATLIADKTYRLSKLIRGLGISEAVAARNLSSGKTCIALDNALIPITYAPDDIGKTWLYRVGPLGKDHADPSFTQLTALASPLAAQPYAPVHAKARRTSAGVEISFIRRTRIGGDSWDVAEVPLSEETERYEVEIYDGATLKRTLTCDAPLTVYANADELADFSSPQTSLSLRIYQMSQAVGRGEGHKSNIQLT
jgi:hypothetical protein